LADVYLDTAPESGGDTLLMAFILGLPAIAFANDYTINFTAANWSHADILYKDNELLINTPGDYKKALALLEQLKNNPDMYSRVSKNTKITAAERHPYADFARKMENIYTEVIQSKML